MSRPCTCEQYVPGSDWAPPQCKLCWLYHHHPGYHQKWGGESAPGLLKKGKNFLSSLAGHVRKGLPVVPTEEYDRRMDICKACDFFLGGSCTKCGCGMKIKARWAGSSCPVGKWTPGPVGEGKEDEPLAAGPVQGEEGVVPD